MFEKLWALLPFSSPASSNWFGTLDNLDCPNSTADVSIECIRSKTTEEILIAIAPFNDASALDSGFGPTVDNITIFSDCAARGAAGNFAMLPMLVGNNDYESGYYELLAIDARLTINPDLITFYRDYADATQTCGASVAGYYRTKAQVPVWRYRFYGDFPNTRIFSGIGAYHTSEIYPLFGTSAAVTGEAKTLSQELLGDYMRAAWAAFAKDPWNGLSLGFGWPLYNNESEYKLSFRIRDTAF
jgi:carboxylesterase type B